MLRETGSRVCMAPPFFYYTKNKETYDGQDSYLLKNIIQKLTLSWQDSVCLCQLRVTEYSTKNKNIVNVKKNGVVLYWQKMNVTVYSQTNCIN